MFAIIITEKGGNERREVFDRTEINVGRVQGNELMLPKGNVSKHHARLLYRDGRFIVTDLKSTNGTYVNGRKITQATIVREGDKIYIGDFILRLEVPQQQQPAQGAAPIAPPIAAEEPPERISSSRNPAVQPPASRPPPRRQSQDNPVSHYPLENDPDEQSWSGEQQNQAAPAPPPAPGPAAPLRMPAPPRVPSPPARDRVSSAPSSRSSGPAPEPSAVPLGVPSPPRPPAQSVTGGMRPQSPARDVPAYGSPESVQLPAQRVAAVALITRVEQSVDLKPLSTGADPPKPIADRIERALRDTAASLRSGGEIAPQADVEAIVREAREEILGLGPLAPLLDDEDVIEVHVHRHAWVTTVRASGPRRAEVPFASEACLDRILRRLCARAQAPVGENESTVERHVQPGNASLVAAFAPVSSTGPVATLRKCTPASQNLEDLVRSGTMSRAMASFLGNAIAAHINILITVAPGADGRSVVGGLLTAVHPDDHIVVAHDTGCQLNLPRNATSIHAPPTPQGAEAVRAAARLGPDCLFVTHCGGLITSEVLDAVAGGCDGVVAVMRAPTLRHAFARAVPEVVGHRAGLPIEAVREWLNASFDIAIELVRLRDGRSRIARIAEPAGVEGNTIALRDIFTFTVERTASGGTVEGSFHPSGVVPKVAENLQARGLGLDPGLFRR